MGVGTDRGDDGRGMGREGGAVGAAVGGEGEEGGRGAWVTTRKRVKLVVCMHLNGGHRGAEDKEGCDLRS